MMRLFLLPSSCEATGEQKENEIATIDDIDSSGVTYGSSKSSYSHMFNYFILFYFLSPRHKYPGPKSLCYNWLNALMPTVDFVEILGSAY